MHLLSHESSNAKLRKTVAGWETWIMYLAPSTLVAGVNMCPASSAGCDPARGGSCLFTAGRGQMCSVSAARIRKTELYRDDHATFMTLLVADLEAAVLRGAKGGKRTAVRLNGTSDVDWENVAVHRRGAAHPSVMAAFPEITFYDYTKRANRVARMLHGIDWPANYRLTFSRSEVNDRLAKTLAKSGANVAVVFGAALPADWMGVKVIDGTAHDLRFLDPHGVIVGLTAKGKARCDNSGFVVRATA